MRIVVIFVSLLCLPVVAVVALFTGALNPLLRLQAQHNIDILQRHVYVGESRRSIETQFGQTIPRPDRLSGYAVSSEYAVPGWGDHLGQYFYSAEAQFCVQYYRGLVVFYDEHERVKFWKPFGSGDVC